MAVWVGFRAVSSSGEVLGLRWSDVDFEKSTVRVERQRKTITHKNSDGSTKKRNRYSRLTTADAESTCTKTKKSRTITKIPDEIMQGLKKFKSVQNLQKETLGHLYSEPDSDYIARYEDGYLLGTTYPLDILHYFLDKNGVQIFDENGKTLNMRFHDLRYTRISRWAMAKTPLVEIMAWAGHSNISTTQVYLHYECNKMVIAEPPDPDPVDEMDFDYFYSDSNTYHNR